MFLSAQAFFENSIPDFNRLLIRAEADMPAEWLRRFRKNVIPLTPLKTGALRRSIITRQLGGTAEVSWRAPYALAQNEGGHTVPRSVKGINPATGRGSTIAAGYYRYRKYTTPGTGPHYANEAYVRTNSELPQIVRELGLTL